MFEKLQIVIQTEKVFSKGEEAYMMDFRRSQPFSRDYLTVAFVYYNIMIFNDIIKLAYQ